MDHSFSIAIRGPSV